MRKILFVCSGNTCRSVIAQYLLKDILSKKQITDFEVNSCGIIASSNFKVPQVVKEIFLEDGINFSGHTPTPLNFDLVKQADLILVMETWQKEVIISMFPEFKDKVFLLKEYVGEKGDIADPIGGSEELYRQTYQELKRLIEKGFGD